MITHDAYDKLTGRKDELAHRRVLPEFVTGARVIQVGSFHPGDEGSYASFLMILEWPNDELSLHQVAFRDDVSYDTTQVDPKHAPEWFAFNGNYGCQLRELQEHLVTVMHRQIS